MKDVVELKPIRETPSDYDNIEKRIKDLFLKEIYSPLIKEFDRPVKTLKNARYGLVDALQSGKMTYHRGKFSGKLSASLSRELRALGAKWNRVDGCYSIPLADLPIDIRNVISTSSWKFEEKIAKIDAKLAAIIPEQLAAKLNLSDLFDKSIWKVEKDFQQSVKNLTVAPQFTAERRRALAEDWQKNMELWVSDFTKEEIVKLRKDLSESIFAGNRYEHAVSSLQKSYGITENKAKFLARQETSLAMTSYKYNRYKEVGVDEYRWRSVVGTPSHPVRPRHKELNDASAKGKVFRFSDPPVTSDAGQAVRHNNPGQDYNCRCVAIPIVRFK